MNQTFCQRQSPHQQQGAALMVGLVMLLVLTLLGVSNMRMTTLELRMSANTQNRNQAFQAAASAIAPALENFNSSNIDPLAPETFTGIFNSSSANSSADAVVTYQGRTSGSGCPGTSFRFACIHFEIQATGRHNASNAVSRQVQGVYTLAPGS